MLRPPDTTDVLPVALAPGRRLRRQSAHHRPLTAQELRSRRIRLLGVGLLGVTATAVVGPVLAFLIGYAVFSMPDPREAMGEEVALVAYRDGSPLARLVPEDGERIAVPIEEVPVPVRHAVLAAEDPDFPAAPGPDLADAVRTAWNPDRDAHAGIGQQLVERAIAGHEHPLWRTYKAVVLAVKLAQRDHDDILGEYLNSAYFGRGAFGIQAAAQAYFGKDAQDLTPAEGALLAGLIESPSRWDPALHAEQAGKRWAAVLDEMLARGWLTPAERAGALFPPTLPRRSLPGDAPTDSRGHVVTAVTAELAELGFTQQDLHRRGLQVTTTIDPHRQRLAVEAAHAALDGQPVDLRGAVVAVDPRTGGVLAYYGGDNGLGPDQARVRRPAGSTFAPFAVLAGLTHEPPIAPGVGPEPGPDLAQAMAVPDDVVLRTLTAQVGPEAVVASARAAGITAPHDIPADAVAPAEREVSTLELAAAYATIAADGVRHEPHLVASVLTPDGDVLYAAGADGERRFSEQAARTVVDTMLGVARHAGVALPDGRPVAAKTGTVASRVDGEPHGGWVSGFTPSLVSAVWTGTDDTPIRTARGTRIEGDGLPGEMWQDFMSAALGDAPAEDFPPLRPVGTPSDPPTPAAGPARAAAPPGTSAPARPSPPAPDAGAGDPGPKPPPTPDVTRSGPDRSDHPDEPDQPDEPGDRDDEHGPDEEHDPDEEHGPDDEDCSTASCG